jgi:signal transduction histidine kinase
MKPEELAKAIHDLRAPLARAKTLVKLLAEAKPEEAPELLREIMKELNDLDRSLSPKTFSSETKE